MSEDTAHADEATVTRRVELDADVDTVWHALSDPDERRLWLDDPDAVARHVRVDESRPGERLVWTWWHPGDEGDASTVTVDLHPVTDGGTHVVVTEALPATPPVLVPQARAAADRLHAASHLAGPAPSARARRSPGWLRCARDRWDARLLGLELLFVAAAVRVG
jgi:uncharacterized protein YndB with AHSA1/START domain